MQERWGITNNDSAFFHSKDHTWLQFTIKACYLICAAVQANGGIERAVLDAYCWMYSSWNIPQEYKGACTGGDQVMRGEGVRGGKGGLLIINNSFLTRCITAYVPSTIETILYNTFCAFFVNIKRQRFAFAQDRRWQYTKLLLSLLFT